MDKLVVVDRPWGSFSSGFWYLPESDTLWDKFCAERYQNHREHNHRKSADGGTYLRDEIHQEWSIDIPDIDTLLALQKESEYEFILSIDEGGRPCLKVFDDYL